MVEGKNCAHRQPSRDDRVTRVAHKAVLVLHRLVPIFPGCIPEVIDAAAVSSKLRDMDRIAGAGETTRNVAHFGWRAAQSMNKQKARLSSGEANALVRNMRRHS